MILFGLIYLVFVAVYATAWALPFATLASYAALALARRRGRGRGVQLAVGAVTLFFGFVLAGAVLIVGTTGNAGQGMQLFGLDMDDPWLLAPAVLTPFVIVAGELLVSRLRAG